MCLGKLLIGAEIVMLNNKCLETITNIMNTLNMHLLKKAKIKNLRGYAFKYQTCLQILCMLNMGAQRRQVISGMANSEIEPPKNCHGSEDGNPPEEIDPLDHFVCK